ncbi:LPS translocon maturation chaperone LptM [Pseudohongiella acticola]|uniref:LPS translocon maturation chaperone LptM n=1 Tax=Pseudohongiella acticola TaxID=1524254 RepID=UPI0024813D83
MTAILMSGLGACGQKGPLQRPEAPTLNGQQNAAISIPSGQYESILLSEQRTVC